MATEEEEMQSIQALADFAKDLRGMLDDSCLQDTGNIKFDATVSYAYDDTTILGSANVYLTRNGYDDGMVQLLESKKFDPNALHTQYTPKWQVYTYDSGSNTFTVSGKSKKYGYDYKVSIVPV